MSRAKRVDQVQPISARIDAIYEILITYPPFADYPAQVHSLATDIEFSIRTQTIRQCSSFGVNMWETPNFQLAYNNTTYNLLPHLDCNYTSICPTVQPNHYLLNLFLAYITIDHLMPPCKLKQRLLIKTFNIRQIAQMPPEQINPVLYKQLIHTRILREAQTYEKEYATHYTCECGAKKTIVRAVQLRGNDEGMADHICCVVCNREWYIDK